MAEISRRQFLRGAGAAVATALLAAAGSSPPVPPQEPAERVLPLNTKLDKDHNLLYSANIDDLNNQIETIRMVVTGFPEEANELAQSKGNYLDAFFASCDEKTACMQVYTGNVVKREEQGIGIETVNVYQKVQENLKHALDKADKPVDLVVYSFGALSLIDLPDEYLNKIRSLRFISPFVGTDVINTSHPILNKILGVISGLPSTSDYFGKVKPLVEQLLQAGKSVSVDLGSRDELIKTEDVQKAFTDTSLQVTVDVKDREHGISANDLVGYFNQLNPQTSPQP